MPRHTIAAVIRNGIANDATTEAILAQVYADFPAAQTDERDVAFYRWQTRRNAARAAGEFSSVRATPTTRVQTASDETFDPAMLDPTRRFGIEFEFMGNEVSMADYGIAIRDALAAVNGDRRDDSRVSVRRDYFHSDGSTWDLKTDSTCEYELATPALTAADWPKVVAVAEALRRRGATVSVRCGTHVHHDANDLTSRGLRSLVRLWVAFDEPIHEALPESRRSNTYAARFPVATAERIAAMPGYAFRREIQRVNRYTSLNATGWWRNGRVEVRSHHGTLDAAKIGFWIVMAQKVIARAKTGRLDALVAGVAGARDRFARFARVVGTEVGAVFAGWMRERNRPYWLQMTERQAA